MQARAERILYGVSCFVVSIKIVIISIQIAKVLTFFVTLHRFSRKLKHFMKILKWGFIGCGEVTEKKSGPAFNEVEGSSIVAVMSRNELKARTYAINHGVPKWYTDAQQLVDDPDVNAIYVATPPSSHATFAIMAMKAGKPVYVEKPLAASYEDCARINSISERTGVPCFVAYYRRYLPYFLKVKKMVEKQVKGMERRELEIQEKLEIQEGLVKPHAGTFTENRGTHQAHVMIGRAGYGSKDDKRIALYFLNNILGGPGMNSRLNIALREHRGLVYTVESSLTNYTDTSTWAIYFGCDEEDVERCLRIVRRELDKLMNEPLTERQFQAALKQMKGQIGVACDNFENYALDVAKAYLHYNKFEGMKDTIEHLEKVTPQRLQEVAREMFDGKGLTTLIFRS